MFDDLVRREQRAVRCMQAEFDGYDHAMNWLEGETVAADEQTVAAARLLASAERELASLQWIRDRAAEDHAYYHTLGIVKACKAFIATREDKPTLPEPKGVSSDD